MENSNNDLIKTIVNKWFLSEPLLFAAICTHSIKENKELTVPFSTGNMVIEYNLSRIKNYSEKDIEILLIVEVIRIILKHPYSRLPRFPNHTLLYIASTITISDICDISGILSPVDFSFNRNLNYEKYYDLLLKLDNKTDLQRKKSTNKTNNNQGNEKIDKLPESFTTPVLLNFFSITSLNYKTNFAEATSKWGNNESSREIIDNAILSKIQETNNTDLWGTLSANLRNVIYNSANATIKWQYVLSKFNKSIKSNQRILTRLKPNRRYDFDYFGSRYTFSYKLLVAIDISGSITDTDISKFLKIINKFFKHEVYQIDCIQFDASIKGKIIQLQKATRSLSIEGRGGTDFTQVFHFFLSHMQYDGFIIFTDGFSEIPTIKIPQKNIVWIINSLENFTLFRNRLKNNRNQYVTYIT